MRDESRLTQGMRVSYVTDISTIRENGTVSTWNYAWVFVKYDSAVHRHGLDGATAVATRRVDLVEIDQEGNHQMTQLHI